MVPRYLWRAVLTLTTGQVGVASFATSRPHETEETLVVWTVLVVLEKGLVIVQATGEKQTSDRHAPDPATSDLQASLYPYSSVQAVEVVSTTAVPSMRGSDESWSAIWQVRLSDGRRTSWPNHEDHDDPGQRDAAEGLAIALTARLE